LPIAIQDTDMFWLLPLALEKSTWKLLVVTLWTWVLYETIWLIEPLALKMVAMTKGGLVNGVWNDTD
jgi:hypothetical protein